MAIGVVTRARAGWTSLALSCMLLDMQEKLSGRR
jgi:hypothetical protein